MASALGTTHVTHDLKVYGDELSDESLLEQFLNGAEFDSQEAFRALVERHGPMVLGICRHVLNQQHDAEDAFQATFLVLARKAGSIRNRRVLAGWLHEVAHRIAVKARASAVRRRTLERHGVAMAPPAIGLDNQDEAVAWKELRPVLHAEVERLPERYRIPVILSYLEGKTNEEVAELLHWPVGTVKGRLSRARDLLRSRLMRRGLSLSAAFLVTALAQGRVFAEVVPQELVKRTVRLVARFGPRPAPPDSTPPDASPPVDGDLTAQIDTLSTLSGQPLGLVRGVLSRLLLPILVFSMSVGIGLAAVNSGGFSSVRAALSALIPAQFKGMNAPCH